MSEKTERLKKKLREKDIPNPPPDLTKGLSSGSALINLACTSNVDVAWLPNHYYLVVGDSQAGKTMLTLTTLAEAAKNPRFAKHRLIYDNPERGALMDYRKFFGGEAASRIEPPTKDGSSKTLEGFYDTFARIVDQGDPFVYILDSEDALVSEEESKKESKNRKARESGDTKTKGSYGVSKAKLNSSKLREAHNSLDGTDSILIIIKQTRDNIGWDAMYNPKTRSGGRALTFYASLELWFSVKGKIRKTVNKEDRVVGSYLGVHAKKNRVIGGDHSVTIRFYPSFGIDDTGSCVDFLIEEHHWKKENGKITAPEFDFEGREEALIQKIEADGKEQQLRLLVAQTWHKIEEGCRVERKPRYQ